jgi:hypothetical protein
VIPRSVTPEISLNTGEYISVRLAAEEMTYIQRCFGRSIAQDIVDVYTGCWRLKEKVVLCVTSLDCGRVQQVLLVS